MSLEKGEEKESTLYNQTPVDMLTQDRAGRKTLATTPSFQAKRDREMLYHY
jgi:hypothetical protein